MEVCRKNIYLTERYRCTPQIRFNLNCTQFNSYMRMAPTYFCGVFYENVDIVFTEIYRTHEVF
jgi:hypothetical protein